MIALTVRPITAAEWGSGDLRIAKPVRWRWVGLKIKIIVHEAEEGGFWAEVPAIPGCAGEGETLEELLDKVHEAVEGCLSIDVRGHTLKQSDRVLEIAV